MYEFTDNYSKDIMNYWSVNKNFVNSV